MKEFLEIVTLREKSWYSVSPNAGKIRTRITPNTDTFYAVLALEVNWFPGPPNFFNSVKSDFDFCFAFKFLRTRFQNAQQTKTGYR